MSNKENMNNNNVSSIDDHDYRNKDLSKVRIGSGEI
jgi:hypothetical protein